MKILIKQEKCAGHGRCAAVAPSVYTLDDNGYIARSEIEVPESMKEAARRGARACPERIIKTEE